MGDARTCSHNAHICFLEHYPFHLIDNFLETSAKQNFPETLERLRDACAFVEQHFLASPLPYDIRSLYGHDYDCSKDGELGSLLKGACPIHIERQDTINIQCL